MYGVQRKAVRLYGRLYRHMRGCSDAGSARRLLRPPLHGSTAVMCVHVPVQPVAASRSALDLRLSCCIRSCAAAQRRRATCARPVAARATCSLCWRCCPWSGLVRPKVEFHVVVTDQWRGAPRLSCPSHATSRASCGRANVAGATARHALPRESTRMPPSAVLPLCVARNCKPSHSAPCTQ